MLRAEPRGVALPQLFHSSAECRLKGCDPTGGSVVAARCQPLQHAHADRKRHRGPDERRAEQSRLRTVLVGVQARADLAELAKGHDIHVLAELKLVEVEHLERAAEGLDLIQPYRDGAVAAQLHQRDEELPRRDVKPALPLHKLHDEACVPARVAVDELPQSLHGLPRRFLGPPGVVKGNIVHRDVQRQTHPARGRVADLDQRGGSTREALGKGQHPRSRGVVLKADLQRRLVGQRSGVYEKAVCQPRRAARFPRQ